MRVRYPELTENDVMEGEGPSLARVIAESARETIDFAKSYTGELVTGDGSLRPRHAAHGGPPGWADKTGELVGRYFAEVEEAGPRKVVLIIGNNAPHASLVEGKGYYVVEGLPELHASLVSRRLT